MRSRLGLAAASPLAVLALGGCVHLYGADFDYPENPPLPPGASVVGKDSGADDDYPVRGRRIDFWSSDSDAEVVEFYRREFTESDGWKPASPAPEVGGGQLLCLVNRGDDGYDEYLELYPDVTSDRQHHYRVMMSRLAVLSEDRPKDQCGQAAIYYPG